MYEARAVVFIAEKQSPVLDSVKPVVDGQFRNADMINTMVDVLGSYPFALRVVDRLKLNNDTAFLKSASIDEKRVPPERAARILGGMVRARYREGTRLVDITATNRVAAEAQILANGYAEEYLRYVFDQRADATQTANQSLIQEAERLRGKMRTSEEAMQSFRERERTASLENMQEEAQTKLTEVTSRATKLEDKLLQIKRDLAAARIGTNSPEDLLRLPSVANDPKVAALTASISEQERNMGLVVQRYRAKHPSYVSAKTGLQFSINERSRILKDAINVMETAFKQTEVQLDQARQTRIEYEKQMLGVTAKSIDYNDLKRELETDSAMYNAVLERLKEVDVTRSLSDTPVQIHQLADEPTVTSSSPPKTIAAGIFGGLIMGIAIAIGLHLFDQTIKTIDEAEHISGLSVFSHVPLIKGPKSKRGLVAFTQRDGAAAEAFRTLRASLTLPDSAMDERSVFLFTSPLPAEGKTFASSNFAVTLSQQNLRTLLIDADLRRPGLSRLFLAEKQNAGLADVLSGSLPLEAALTPTEIPNLTVLSAGHSAPNPSELLSTPAFSKLLTEALKSFDRVVIDSPPCMAVSDTLLLAPRVDVCCLVVRAFATPKGVLKRALKILGEANCQPAGIVLNCLPPRNGDYYYYYSSIPRGSEVYGETV
ncbi:MAG: polysaccharide biosynthesis tyrosine autokinase [Terrimicrobiaceae bacterium]|nr:polysaccharide biosynthesis tyrosine autokinase [Terrimicrobiaceae bacterium]